MVVGDVLIAVLVVMQSVVVYQLVLKGRRRRVHKDGEGGVLVMITEV